MAQRRVTVEELFLKFEQLIDFVCADEDQSNEVVVGVPGHEAVVIVPYARLVAQRLALKTYQKQFKDGTVRLTPEFTECDNCGTMTTVTWPED